MCFQGQKVTSVFSGRFWDLLVTSRPGKPNLQRHGKVQSMRGIFHGAAALWVLPDALCVPGKGLTVDYFLEVIGSEDVVSMAQYTQHQSAGARLLYSVLPKIACSLKWGISQLSIKLWSLLHSSGGRRGVENPSPALRTVCGWQGWHWGGWQGKWKVCEEQKGWGDASF